MKCQSTSNESYSSESSNHASEQESEQISQKRQSPPRGAANQQHEERVRKETNQNIRFVNHHRRFHLNKIEASNNDDRNDRNVHKNDANNHQDGGETRHTNDNKGGRS